MNKKDIKWELVEVAKEKPADEELTFGKIFTDHMFTMDFTTESGWHNPEIKPYQPLMIDPSAMVFHYGQSVFEGMKAYLSKDGNVQLFRPQKNMQRLNHSNDRLCIPQVDEDFALEAIEELVGLEKDWIPSAEGTSLYIRPFIISSEPFLGVAPSQHYQFIVILSPVGAYYEDGIDPVKIAVENHYVRAVTGGTGEAKTGGNYASSLKAQELVANEGFAQVLWLDGLEHKYIEEVGSMNVFFKINGEIVTPELNGSILEGVTRNTTIQLLEYWGYRVTERQISMDDLYEAHQKGMLEEAFGTGTAAVISPIGQLSWGAADMVINESETGSVARSLYDTITGIQYGKEKDPFNWVVKVDTKARKEVS